MPKKAPPPPEPAPEPAEQDPQDNPAETVDQVLFDILAKTHEVVQEHQLKEKAFPAAVRHTAAEILGVVEYRYTSPDKGTSVSEQTGLGWSCDEDPPPSALDTWARGAVPIKVRPKLKIDAVGDEEILPGGMATGRSMRSLTSRGSRRSRTTRSRESVRGSVSGDGDPKMIVAHSRPVPPKQINKLDEAARSHVAELNAKINAIKAKDQALADELEGIKAVLQDLKGTEYGYNHKGEIIMLENVKPERLPSQSVHLRVGLWSQSQAAAETEDEAGGRRRRGGSRRARQKGGGAATDPGMTAGSVVKAGALQGPIADTLPVGVGVLMRAGETERRGPQRARDPMRMSRKDYNKLLSIDGDTAPGLGDTTATWDKPDDGGEDDDFDEELEEERDWMADARPATPEDEEEEPLPEAMKNHMEFNESIIGSSEWGTNPPPAAYQPPLVPDKSNLDVQRRSALGEPSRLPRERPFDKVPGIPPSLATRLPAPIYPAASGHGSQAYNMSYTGPDTSVTSVTPRQASSTENVSLPPIGVNSSILSQQSSASKKKRKSFNNNPPNIVHNLQPQLARKYLGVRAS